MTVRRFLRRTTSTMIAFAATWWCGSFITPFAAAAKAQTWSPRSSPYYTTDPFDVVPPPGTVGGGASVEVRPQFAPFAQGYNLVGGFRPAYQGVPQPIGHEIISTHHGNGYVYRPVYAPSPGYHYTPQGALVIERPGRYPVPSSAAYPTTMPYPTSPYSPTSKPQPTGPREF